MAAATFGTSCTPGANAQVVTHKNSVAIAIGQVVTVDDTDAEKRLILADDSTAVKANARGIAVSTATVANQRVSVVWDGDVDNCTAGVQFEARYVSDTPGSACPVADLGALDYGTSLGIYKTTTTFTVKILATGVAHA